MIPTRKKTIPNLHLLFVTMSCLIGVSILWQSSQLVDGTLHHLVHGGAGTNGAPSLGDSRQRAVFYNVYIPNAQKKARALRIVREQMKTKAGFASVAEAPVYYTLIGLEATEEVQTACGSRCEMARYAEEGDEGLTLQLLYEYCVDHPEALVTYIHDKGSLHGTVQNSQFRALLTKGAFADECQEIGGDAETSCNVCGARFSPFPHPHVAGNMWTAQCSYVRKLIPPDQFDDAMEALMGVVRWHRDALVPRPTEDQYDLAYFVGRGRFAMEHWIGSHPSIRPCDVYEGEYLCGYRGLPSSDDPWQPSRHPAPRFPLSLFQKRSGDGNWFCGQARLLEYQYLYNERPPPEAFVWTFYDEPFKDCPTPLNRSQHEHLFEDFTNRAAKDRR